MYSEALCEGLFDVVHFLRRDAPDVPLEPALAYRDDRGVSVPQVVADYDRRAVCVLLAARRHSADNIEDVAALYVRCRSCSLLSLSPRPADYH